MIRAPALLLLGLVVVTGCDRPAPQAPEPTNGPEPARDERDAVAGCKATVMNAVVSPKGLLHLPCSLGKKPGLLAADTGANRSFFLQSWTEGMASTPAQHGLRRFRGVFIGPFAYDEFDALSSPTAPPSDLPGASGFIGTDVLSRFVTVFDWRTSTMAFIGEAEARQCVPSWTFPSIPLEDYSSEPSVDGPPNIPTLRIRISPPDGSADAPELANIPVQLDTGSTESWPRDVLHVNRALGGLLRKRFAKMPSRTSSFSKVDGKRVDVVTYDAPEGVAVVAGTIRLSPITFIEHPPESEGAYARKPPYGVLGATALRKLGRLGIDPFSRTLRVMNSDREP